MFQSSPSSLLFLSFGLIMLISQTLADHDLHHQPTPCQDDATCGAGATCYRGQCVCSDKGHVFIVKADPHCQAIGTINGICKYDEQCTAKDRLSRCHNSKCECYDTHNKGRDLIKEYLGTCYEGTALGEECREGPNQCKAWIEPEDHVDCVHNSTANAYVCVCKDGAKCEHKSNAQSVHVNYFVTFALVGLMTAKAML